MPLKPPDSSPSVRELHLALVQAFASVDQRLDALASDLAALSDDHESILAAIEDLKAQVAGLPTTPTTPPPQPEPPPSGTPMPTGVGGNWTLDFRDEFDGTALDTSKWRTGLPWDHHSAGNGEKMVYTADLTSGKNLQVTGGMVKLKSTYVTPATANCDGGYCSNFASAMIQTRERHFTPDQGPAKYLVRAGSFVEGKLKVPRFTGMFPAFWLLGEQHEIDLMEVFGDVNEYSCGYHINKYSGGGSGGKLTEPGEHISDDPDVFGCDWKADGGLDFYFNGAKMKSFPAGSIPGADAMGIFLNVAIGSNFFPGLPTASELANSPSMDVEYVRVWKKTA